MSTPRKIRCTVEAITNHGDQVYTIELKPERPVPTFHPGQFLHLALDEYDPSACWPESRVFSIASSPTERDRVRIIYSVKGLYTARMEQELVSGRGVWIKLPYGEFMVDGRVDAVLIAGGTGITAFQAFIEGLAPDHPNKVVLLYGARRPGLLLGREGIEEKMQSVPAFQAYYFSETQSEFASHNEEAVEVEFAGLFGVRRLDAALDLRGSTRRFQEGQTPDRDRARQAGLLESGVKPPHSKTVVSPTVQPCGRSILPGRIQLDVLHDCPLSATTVYYLAGPPPMVSALTNELAQRGVSGHNIRVDAWE